MYDIDKFRTCRPGYLRTNGYFSVTLGPRELSEDFGAPVLRGDANEHFFGAMLVMQIV